MIIISCGVFFSNNSVLCIPSRLFEIEQRWNKFLQYNEMLNSLSVINGAKSNVVCTPKLNFEFSNVLRMINRLLGFCLIELEKKLQLMFPLKNDSRST